MTHQGDERHCPRCDATLRAEHRQGDEGLMYLWLCACGWAGARTVSRKEDREERFRSGVVSRLSDGLRRRVGS